MTKIYTSYPRGKVFYLQHDVMTDTVCSLVVHAGSVLVGQYQWGQTMDQTLGILGKVMAWGTVVAIGVFTTVLAVWLIRFPQITEGTSWEPVARHPGLILVAAGVAMLPWWTMVFSAVGADHIRSSQSNNGLKGPADWLSVMIADQNRRNRRW